MADENVANFDNFTGEGPTHPWEDQDILLPDEIAESLEDDTVWQVELEVALSEGCDVETLRNITKNRPLPEIMRAAVWQVCLDVSDKSDDLTSFDGLFDLPEQTLIREDCHSIVEKLGNEEEEKISVSSDLESLVTLYCKTCNLTYEKGCGWLELVQPLLSLNYSRAELYNAFYAIRMRFIPRNCKKNSVAYSFFRLLLLYHDPELCGFLDTKRVTPDLFLQSWFTTLFASRCDLRVILNMWDVYFQLGDQFLLFFLALVILVNARDQLLVMQEAEKQEIIDKLVVFPSALEAEDVEDFCSLAQYYSNKTPQSFRQDYLPLLFGYHSLTAKLPDGSKPSLDQALCLSVAVDELLLANQLSNNLSEAVRYFIVDCRPADQYNSGHLPTAFHLDADLMLRSPADFSTAVSALLATQQRALSTQAGGEHLCFMGSGREEEDQYLHMVVAHFLQRRTQYISTCAGGFIEVHRSVEDDLVIGLAEHQCKKCIVCNPNASQQLNGTSPDTDNSLFHALEPALSQKFEKLSTAVKSTSAIMKEKMVSYIKNEPTQTTERHVSSNDRGKRYRNMASVFTIDDDDDADVGAVMSDDEGKPVVDLEAWSSRPEVKFTFDCQAIDRTANTHHSRLCITDSHLIVLRISLENPATARIQSERTLSSILKITSKKRHPEFITFKYGNSSDSKSSSEGSMTITAIDRFIIPRAGEATKCIKQQIIRVLDSGDS